MKHRSYLIKDTTLAFSDDEGKKTMLTISVGSVVTVGRPAAQSAGMFNVLWNGRHLLMFARDLHVRGEKIPGHAA